MNITDEDHGLRYSPFTGPHGCVGYRVERLRNGAVVYIYLSPSGGGDGDSGDVFVYMGVHGDPAEDEPLHFYAVEDADFAVEGDDA